MPVFQHALLLYYADTLEYHFTKHSRLPNRNSKHIVQVVFPKFELRYYLKIRTTLFCPVECP